MNFRFIPSIPSYKMFLDKGNLDKVTYNLLSNAFKYTPSNGTIILSVTVDEVKRHCRFKYLIQVLVFQKRSKMSCSRDLCRVVSPVIVSELVCI